MLLCAFVVMTYTVHKNKENILAETNAINV